MFEKHRIKGDLNLDEESKSHMGSLAQGKARLLQHNPLDWQGERD